LRELLQNEGVCESKHHGDTNADQERSVALRHPWLLLHNQERTSRQRRRNTRGR